MSEAYYKRILVVSVSDAMQAIPQRKAPAKMASTSDTVFGIAVET